MRASQGQQTIRPNPRDLRSENQRSENKRAERTASASRNLPARCRLTCANSNNISPGRGASSASRSICAGTDFQLACWRALLAIPYGETRTYADIARAVGRPRGFRAVGRANNRNPLAIVVPCHRVIASDGTLCGYGGGLDVKRKLLELEGALTRNAGGIRHC